MEWENRFFRNIWRFNALALAVVLVLGGLTALIALVAILIDLTRERSVHNLADHRPEAAAAAREAAGALRPLGDTGLFWAPVTRESRGALAYSSKQVSAVIDHVLYDPARGASRLLLGRRPGLVLSARMLRAKPAAGAPPARDAALAVVFVAEDGNGDGRLSARDPVSLAIAAPTGAELRVVATGDAVLGVEAISDTRAVATMRESSRDGLRAVAIEIDLERGRAIRKTPLLSSPSPAG